MKLFSERYGYTKPSDVIIRERITPEIQNAIYNCFFYLIEKLSFGDTKYSRYNYTYNNIETEVWVHFFNGKKTSYEYQFILNRIEDDTYEWYKKLDLIEYFISVFTDYVTNNNINSYIRICIEFIDRLNKEFKRLNFAYRMIDGLIVEVTSDQEIKAIEDALNSDSENIRNHLHKALELYSKRPEGDFCNSIKESISAVEVFCREKTGEDTLGQALNKLESKGIVIHKLLKSAFDKLYAYTNQPDTGVRHALMDKDGDYVPQAEEALFMLVSCSTFINYLNKKIK